MLQKVDLASLSIRHVEPVFVVKFLAKSSIAGVGVAELGSLLFFWECFLVLSIELLHKLASEGPNSRPHRHQVHRYDVLKDESEDHYDSLQEFFRELVGCFFHLDDVQGVFIKHGV